MQNQYRWQDKRSPHSQQEVTSKVITLIANAIPQNSTHPLNCHFTVMPFGWRYRVPICNRIRSGKSLIPTAIVVLNKVMRWGYCESHLYMYSVCVWLSPHPPRNNKLSNYLTKVWTLCMIVRFTWKTKEPDEKVKNIHIYCSARHKKCYISKKEIKYI